LGRTDKSKQRIRSRKGSHTTKTAKQREEYDLLVKTAPATDPTDETGAMRGEKRDYIDAQAPQPSDVVKKRSRIPTEGRKVSLGMIGTVVGLTVIACTVVGFYVRLESKVGEIQEGVVETKRNTKSISDHVTSVRERVAQLEGRVDMLKAAHEVVADYAQEVESIKAAIKQMEKEERDFRQLSLREIEKRIEKLEGAMEKGGK